MSYAGMGQILDALAAGRGPIITSPAPAPKPSTIVPSGGIVMRPMPMPVGPAPSAVARGPVVVVSPVAPARPVPSASAPIANAAVAKAEVDRLFRAYQATSYSDALRRNNLRRELLAAGRRLVALLWIVRPTTEQERLRLRAIAASALASSQLRQRCFMSGAAGCGRFGVNEPDGPSKTNDEFLAMTRPLDTFIKTRNTTPFAVPVPPRVTVVVAGRPVVTVAPGATKAVVTAAKEGVTVAAAKLASDVATAQKVTNPETKVAADKVVIAQAGADAAAKAAEEKAEQAKRAAEAALQATQTAQATGAAADAQAAQVAAQVADAAHVAAEQATVAATEIATVADVARSELEVAATVTNDVPAQEATTEATMTVAVATAGLGPLGISWKAWGIGAAALVAGYLLVNSKMMSANRRRMRRNVSAFSQRLSDAWKLYEKRDLAAVRSELEALKAMASDQSERDALKSLSGALMRSSGYFKAKSLPSRRSRQWMGMNRRRSSR